MATHPLRDRLTLIIDVDPATGWPGGLNKLKGVRLDTKPITGLLVDPRMSFATAKWIDQSKLLFPMIGVRFGSGWDYYPGDPSAAAKAGSDFITHLEADGKRRVDAVEWDIETSDFEWEKEFLLGSSTRGTKGIRGANGKMPNPNDGTSLGYRWGRFGVWTMEGRKAQPYSAAELAAKTGLLVGPQNYWGGISILGALDPMFDLQTWCLNNNPDRPQGAKIPLSQILPFMPANRAHRMAGSAQAVLFAATQLTELYE